LGYRPPEEFERTAAGFPSAASDLPPINQVRSGVRISG
jgi:hypothetical protein